MGEYNFGDWLQSQVAKDFTELLKNGEEDAAEAEAGSVGISGAVQKREGRPRFKRCPAWTGS